jgi:hypothetical protein
LAEFLLTRWLAPQRAIRGTQYSQLNGAFAAESGHSPGHAGRRAFGPIPLLLVTWAIILIASIKALYIVDTVSVLDRYQAIISPYISEQERLIFKSRMAQLHARAEFIAIVDDLKGIIKKNGLYDPVISIF